MGKISFDGDRGGGGKHRDSDRRRDRDYQSGRFGKIKDRIGESRDRSKVINNNRDRDDLRSRIGKKYSVENEDRPTSVKKRDKPVKITPVKLNHIEEEEKKEEDHDLRQMKIRKLNPNAFALSSIVRKQASENTKVKNPTTKSKGAKALDDDPDVRIVNSNVKDEGKKFAKTVKSQNGALQIANDDDTNVEKKPSERTIKFRADSPVRKTSERTRSLSPFSEQSSSKSSRSSHRKESKRRLEEKEGNEKEEPESLNKYLQSVVDQGLSSKEIENIIKSDPNFTEEDLQMVRASGLFDTNKKKKSKKRTPSPEESSSSSSESGSDSSSSSDSGSRKKKKGKARKHRPVKSSSESESDSSSSSSSSTNEDEKLEDTSSIQSCEPETIEVLKRVDSSRKSKADELSVDEELALNNAKFKALQAKEHEFYVKSKNIEKNHQSRDTLPTPRVDERGGSRSVSIKDKKGSGDSSLNDEEARKQKLLNRSRQKSKSTTDIKSRLGIKIESTDSLNNGSDKPSHDIRGEKRSSPSDHFSDRSKRRRSDHVSSRERTFDIKRESSDRRTRSPYDRRTRSPPNRRTRSPPGRRTRSPYDQRSRSHRENSYDRRERSPVRYRRSRSRSRDDKRSLPSLSKTTSGK